MHSTQRLRCALMLAVVLLMALASGGVLGCNGNSALPMLSPARVVRESFPDQAAQVLAQGDAFVAAEDGFARIAPSGQRVWRHADVALPRDGREAVRIRGFGGVELQVREVGAQGKGVLADRAVAYPRAGGTSFWTAGPGGVEEWLHLVAYQWTAGDYVVGQPTPGVKPAEE